jgi:maltose O-acetyltransferase
MSQRSEKQKMVAGELYNAQDPELVAARVTAAKALQGYNGGGDPALLLDLLASIGPGSELRAPFFCDYGFHIHIGARVFLNFNCVLLDVMPIHIGDDTKIGPGVHIYAADHPRDSAVRRQHLESGRSITIGRNVWIGGGAILLPGITIGDDAIIGAGSVVTRDVVPGATVVGNPARPR